MEIKYFHAKKVHYHNEGRQDYMKGSNRIERAKVPSEMEATYVELFDDKETFILGSRQPVTVKTLVEKFKSIREYRSVEEPDQRTALEKS